MIKLPVTLKYVEWSVKYENKILYRKQIPLILSYAITIHKSQSQTLDECVVDAGKNIFSSGQCYVALSRCRYFNKLYLEKFDPDSIKADKHVLEYLGFE